MVNIIPRGLLHYGHLWDLLVGAYYYSATFFRYYAENAEVRQSDAKIWLERYQGPHFDMIIDDLLGEQQGQPVRVIDTS